MTPTDGMTHGMAHGFAIDYHPAPFSTGGPRLMGLNAANEGLLQGILRHARADTLAARARTRADFASFEAEVRKVRGPAFPATYIAPGDHAALGRIGALLHPYPGIGTLAWTRRFGDPRAYSLLGLTHTTATHAVMDAIGDLTVAPVEPWDALICTSHAVRRTVERVLDHWEAYLAERLGARRLPRPQLPVIPLGVDCARFAPGPAADAARAQLRQRMRLGEDDIAVLWVGRFHHGAKSHPIPAYLALEAAARQLPGRRIVHVQAGWFANDSVEKGFIDAAQRFSPSVRHVLLDGREPEVRRQIWAAADIFMSLSDNLQETFGLTPIEAMAAGLPVVVSDWDGYRDTVRHGVDGLRIPTTMPAPGTGHDLAEGYAAGTLDYGLYCGVTSQMVAVDLHACSQALVMLARDASLRRRMGEAGRRRARECFDWGHVVAQLQALCGELAARRAEEAPAALATPATPATSAAPEATSPTAPPTPRTPAQPAGATTRPAVPLRADPFDIFDAYPTETIGDGLRLAPVAGGAPADRIAELNDHALNGFAKGWRASPGGLRAIAEAVARRPGLSLGELASELPSELAADLPSTADAGLGRTVAWMLKMGLLAQNEGPRPRPEAARLPGPDSPPPD